MKRTYARGAPSDRKATGARTSESAAINARANGEQRNPGAVTTENWSRRARDGRAKFNFGSKGRIEEKRGHGATLDLTFYCEMAMESGCTATDTYTPAREHTSLGSMGPKVPMPKQSYLRVLSQSLIAFSCSCESSTVTKDLDSVMFEGWPSAMATLHDVPPPSTPA